MASCLREINSEFTTVCRSGVARTIQIRKGPFAFSWMASCLGESDSEFKTVLSPAVTSYIDKGKDYSLFFNDTDYGRINK